MSTMLVRSAARVGRNGANGFAKTKSSAYSHGMHSVRAGTVYGGANQSLAAAANGSARTFSTAVMDGRSRAQRELEFQAQDLEAGFSTAHAELYEIGYTNPAGALNHPDPAIRNEALKRLSVKPSFVAKPELLFRKNGSTHTLLEDVQRGLHAMEQDAANSGNALETELTDLMASQMMNSNNMGAGSLLKTSQVSMGAAGAADGANAMQRTFSGSLSEYIDFLETSADAPSKKKNLKEFARSYSQQLARTDSTSKAYDNSASDEVTSAAAPVDYQGLLNAQLTKTLALKAGTPEHEAHRTGVEKKNPNLFARRLSSALNGESTVAAEQEQTRRMALGLANNIEKQDGDGWMGSAAGMLLFAYLGLFVAEDVRFWTVSVSGVDRKPEEFVRR